MVTCQSLLFRSYLQFKLTMSSDTITARREARRRKILDYAEHRLTKIAGNSEDNVEYENNLHIGENGKIHKTEASSSTHISNGGIGLHGFSTKGLDETHSQNHVLRNELNYVNNADIERLITRASEFTSEVNYAFNESFERLMSDGRTNYLTTEETEEKITTTKTQKPSQWAQHICIICLAVMVRFLFALNLGYLINDSMILPYILMTVSRLILTRKQPPPLAGLIRSALILSGISPEKVSYLLEFFVIINQVSLEFSLYLFTFTVTHGLIGTLRTS